MLGGSLAAAAFCALGLSCAHAGAFTYSYTGNDYSSTYNSGNAPQSYATSESVDGSFTVATALGDDLQDVYINPSTFSFSDGIHTISDSNAPIMSIEIWTDDTGQIINWIVALRVLSLTSSFGYEIFTVNYGGSDDQGEYFNCGDGTKSGAPDCHYFGGARYYSAYADSYIPGQWTESDSAITEPGTIVLLGAAFAGFVALRAYGRRVTTGRGLIAST